MPMKNSDDRFSRLCSEILRIERGRHEAHADVAAWHAPGECHGDVERACDNELFDVLSKAGMTRKQFNDKVFARTSYRWAYFNDFIV